MKAIFVLAVLAAVALADEKYSTEHDDFDVEALIANNEQLKHFNDCFLDKSTCDDHEKSFKADIPDAVQSACSKCTDKQKHLFKRYLEGLKEKLPQEYEAFKTKYDPDSKFFSALEAAVKDF